ncbi:MAG: Co2+/Mg2+ efflux protein ApaG [Deltaproteobacteria bacterium]|nr:Co2+/Mg2+ efflux protein ApaG [Deltaproteobacteria bacterium]
MFEKDKLKSSAVTASNAVTQGIRVDVQSEYISERSDPERNLYFFAYHIRITNEGETTAQLVSRHWIITDGDGKTEEVKGPGVVGEQPTLEPGDSFQYSSFCPLSTPVGVMQGSYQMVTDDDEPFDATIAPFKLAQESVTYH